MNSITNLLQKPNDFFISLGDHAFFGEGAYIKDVSIEMPRTEIMEFSSLLYPDKTEYISGITRPATITITAIAPNISVVFNKNTKISLKQIKDCSIDELIFAIREKIRRGEL
jgi:hypothetical protein